MKKRIIITVFAVIVTASVLVGVVYAVLSAKSNIATNKFTAEKDPSITVDEALTTVVETDMNGEPLVIVKKDVCIDVGNPGYTVYVRAKVVVTWKDDAGNVYSKIPTASTNENPGDYTISYNTVETPGAAKQWFEGPDGIYYYTSPVPDVSDTSTEPSGITQPLINICEQLKPAPEGYHLSVEILTQVVQALGTTDVGNIPAVVDAWKVDLTKTETDEGYVYLITGVNSAEGNTAAWEVINIAP